ncbi:Dna[CI] antecedent, DciA [anaerobic digester metagenome]|jgi:predicted nucleic acid-binding Zn ribbon protein
MAKRTTNNQSLRQVIEELIEAYRLGDKLNQARVISLWDNVVGKMIARDTTHLYIKHKTLYVKLNSPALREELGYAKSKLIKSLNKAAGAEVIEDIAFI